MKKPLQALDEIQQFLISQRIDYVVIGGIANAIWGRPRATLDADFKVLIGDRSIADFVALLKTRFQFRVQDWLGLRLGQAVGLDSPLARAWLYGARLPTVSPRTLGTAVTAGGLAGAAIIGYLYWRWGLEHAILAHFSADIVLHVIF